MAAGALLLDPETREVWLDGALCPLTRIEFDLLSFLQAAPRIVLTPAALMDAIWGDRWFGDDHQIEVHISRLRKKLGESAGAPHFIHTVRGVGYRFEPHAGQELHHRRQHGPPFTVIVDRAGVIAWSSSAARSLLNRSSADLVGCDLSSIMDPPIQVEPHDAGQIGAEASATLRTSGGQPIPVRCRYWPIGTSTEPKLLLIECLPEQTECLDFTGPLLPIRNSALVNPVTLMYDADLIVRAVAPPDEMFLGWHPQQILGTFFLLATDPQLLDDQSRAIAVAQLMVDSGITELNDAMLVRTASGEHATVRVRGHLLADDRSRFVGLQAMLMPLS